MMSLMFKKAERYYNVYLQENFFDGVTVVCSWGTFDSHRGGYKYIFCDNMAEANISFNQIMNIRRKRGYKLCSNAMPT